MIRVMFVCYGNICRSPLAEIVFKDMVKKRGKEKDFIIKSSATSFDEIGNPVYYETAKVLDALGLDYSYKHATKLVKEDYDKFDYFIGMDEQNRFDMKRILGGDKDKKVYCLLDFTSNKRDVADPYFTRDFNKSLLDIQLGLNAFYEFLFGKNK